MAGEESRNGNRPRLQDPDDLVRRPAPVPPAMPLAMPARMSRSVTMTTPAGVS